MPRFLFILLVTGSLAMGQSFPEDDVRFFAEKVRPVLEENCFKCHGGTDEKGGVKIRSGLQLISRRGIVQGGDHGPAYDPEKPAESLILHVTSYEDDALKMPPRGKLPDEQRALLAEWVERGLPWTADDIDFLHEVEDGHGEITSVNDTTRAFWSYRPLVRPEVPGVEDSGRGANPIDGFISRRLSEEGLAPNGPASRRELLRRATYGLTGLPPTLAEVEAFENDSSADAWGKVIDRLLASERYGERWARHWLDVVRYAETNGFERDSDKPFIWRYRDYVIRSFNDDKPYDLFLREQLAGDEMDDVSAEAMIATGYHRLMQWDDEPADRLQHLFDNLDDDVRVTAEGVLGMTIGCARCHDHKGDPVSQKDYFSFMAFFRGVKQPGKGNANVETLDQPEDAAIYQGELDRHAEVARNIRKEISKIEGLIEEEIIAVEPAFEERVRGRRGKRTKIIEDALTHKPGFWHYTTEEPGEEWSDVGFRAENAGWKQGPAGFGRKGGTAAKVRTAWDEPQIWLQTSFLLEEIPAGAIMTVHYDEDLELFLNGQPVLTRKGHVDNYETIPADEVFLEALQTGRNVLAAHLRQSGGGQYFDLSLQTSNSDGLTLDEAIALVGEKRLDQGLLGRRAGVRNHLERHMASTPTPGIEGNVVQEVGKNPPPLHVHIRGNANVPGEDVMVPRVPMIFGGKELPTSPPANGRNSSGRRSALAEWITRPDNPRTSRVMVNRVWQHHFGRGICPTPNDFGYLGERPTHPELLDWLATEFVRQEWSLKALHRLILTSRTYQMSSRGQAAGLEKDPGNHLLWRFNLRRLSAEEVRDSILAATGHLNLQMGGPSFYMPVSDAVLATSSKKNSVWGKSSEEDTRRRTVYSKVKRSLVPPLLAEFDAADTDGSCPVRFSSILPTQALALLNSGFANDEAVKFAARLLAEEPDDPKLRIEHGLEIALARPVEAREVDYGTEFIEVMMREHGLSEKEAFERFALLVLNLNEFVFVD